MKTVLFVALALLGPVAHAAEPATQITYAQRLINYIAFKNPDLLELSVHALQPAGTEPVVIASTTSALLGEKSAADDLKVAKTNQPVFKNDVTRQRAEVMLPLRDVNNNVIGTFMIAVRATSDANLQTRSIERATQLRNRLQRVTPSLKDLFDVYYLTSKPTDILAQRLTIAASLRHPEIMVMAMHLKAPGEKDYKIWSTNRPLIMGTVEPGKEDPDVGEGGRSLLIAMSRTDRLFAALPLRAVDGTVCGAIHILSLWENDNDMPTFLAQAMAIRDEFQKDIPSHAALFKP